MNDEDVPIPKKRRKQTCCLCGPTYNVACRIPEREPRRSKWIEFVEAASRHKPGSSTRKANSIRLCILHFTENDIYRDKNGTPMRSTSTAVPSICDPEKFERSTSEECDPSVAVSMKSALIRIMSKSDLPPISVEQVMAEEDAVTKTNKLTSKTSSLHLDTDSNQCEMPENGNHVGNEESEDGSAHISPPTTPQIQESTATVTPSMPLRRRSLRYIGDITTPDLETPDRRRECILLIRHRAKVMRNKIRALETQNKRLKQKIRNLTDVLTKFRKEKLSRSLMKR